MISGTAPPWVGCVEFIAEDSVGWRRAGPEAAEGAKLKSLLRALLRRRGLSQLVALEDTFVNRADYPNAVNRAGRFLQLILQYIAAIRVQK